jgi:DNA-binding CsgD family transcriptional regulator
MPQCITCGSELHPDRAKKYNYCMSPECQEKNLKGLTMVAVGVNKSAEQYMILDDQTRDELAAGKFADQRRGLFGTSVPSAEPAVSQSATASTPPRPATATRPTAATTPAQSATATTPTRPRPARQRPPASRPATRQAPRPWTKSQERLALLYNEQGLRPDEIAQKLGLTRYTVTQIILSSRNRAKL